MKKFRILVLVLLLPVLISATLHKFYVSVTEVEYVKEKQSVQIISRIFIDDFENVLRKRYDEHLKISATNESKVVSDYIEGYIKEKFQIKINGSPVAMTFVGKEYDNDIMFCYFEINNVKEIKSIEFKNKLFFDVFEDQQNIIKTKINSKNRSIILIPQNDKGLLKF